MDMNIAICSHGMTRSTRYVYESHINNLFTILRSNGIKFDTYMHTWKAKENKIWNTISPIPIDYNEYKLLNPTEYIIENQDEFIDSINFSEYFYRNIYDTIGHCTNGEWLPELIMNHLCALESQKRVTKMCLGSGKTYDAVLYIRPDVRIITPFSIQWLKSVATD